MSWPHHHGADGSCHDGPGGLFGCAICERNLEDDDDDDDARDDGGFTPLL